MSARCKSCGAQVVWAVTSTGKRMPVDVEPAAMGNVLLEARTVGAPLAVVWAGPVAGGRLSHFSTCPDAKVYRRR